MEITLSKVAKYCGYWVMAILTLCGIAGLVILLCRWYLGTL